jgi:C_GCAxxG_C_C family probable redox protein
MNATMSCDAAVQEALNLYPGQGCHCAQAVLQVMMEEYELRDEKCLWAVYGFFGGIAGNQAAPCGALYGAVVALGLIYSCDLKKEKEVSRQRLAIREDTDALFKSFISRFGAISCRSLVGIDFTMPGEHQRFLQSDIRKEKCYRYVEFVIRKLYELKGIRYGRKR